MRHYRTVNGCVGRILSTSALQQNLRNQGYLASAPTGYLGPLTAATVGKFQMAHGILNRESIS
jgi:peptidoglycan hydrolase-like protein with peptidoglycan-binding domain